MNLNTYLHFNGNCEDAFNFYAKSLGGKVIASMTYGASPAAAQVPPQFAKKIIHARIALGDQIIMGSDAPPDRPEKPQGFSISIGVPDPAEADRIYKTLSEGGEIRMAMNETFFAHRFGMFVDRFGTPWMVICEKKPA
jgi:PhnB protein